MAIIRVIKGFRFHYQPVAPKPDEPNPRRTRPDREFSTGPVSAAYPHGQPREYEIADDDPMLEHPWIKEDFADGHIESPEQAKARVEAEAKAKAEFDAGVKARMDAEKPVPVKQPAPAKVGP